MIECPGCLELFLPDELSDLGLCEICHARAERGAAPVPDLDALAHEYGSIASIGYRPCIQCGSTGFVDVPMYGYRTHPYCPICHGKGEVPA